MLLLFSLMSLSIAIAQEPEPGSTSTTDSVIYESPIRIELLGSAMLRFQTDAAAYLKWGKVNGATQYSVYYKTVSASSWSSFQVSSTEAVLENLALDTEYTWRVTVSADEDAYVSDSELLSTFPQTEPIKLSDFFYNKLSRWFSGGEPTVGLLDYIATSDIHHYEKLAFLQAFALDNAPLVKSMSNSPIISSWLPPTQPGQNPDILHFNGECKCKVITAANNVVRPVERRIQETGEILPKVRQFVERGSGDKTFVDRFESGPAKFITLRQNENSGGMGYRLSNLQGSLEDGSVTTQSARLRFFLGCANSSGTDATTSNLPERCQCERPLYVHYEYTTRLHVKTEKKNCWFSKGAAAAAEDLAFVLAFNDRTGEMTALDAGHAMLGRQCSTTWNPDFWIQLLNVVSPVAQFLVSTLDTSSSNIPTTTQIEEFIQELQTLIGTPFSNRAGNCETVQEDRVLVSGANTLTLSPNYPITVGLFSAYLVETRGFGCYRSEAGVASDYFLTGVVESQLTEDPECCTDKFATYLLGSLSAPPEADVQVDAVNSMDNRLDDAGFELGAYGSWYNFETSIHTGIVGLKKRQFSIMRGPSCEIRDEGDGGFQDDPVYGMANSTNAVSEIALYPTITGSFVNINIPVQVPQHIRIRFMGIQGKIVTEAYDGLLDKGIHTLSFSVGHLPSGTYIAFIESANNTDRVKFIVH
ncbi:MAG: hypothetical protein SGI94_01135 [Saprospiraceae bacterium]|nr:hypothetical protein [Saprospiraceae bacterium]